MDTETLLLDFMSRVNDAIKMEGTDAERLKKVRQEKQWAEDRYAEISNQPTAPKH